MFHLALASEWRAGWREGRYAPARFTDDGFVHCSEDEATALKIAATHFAQVSGEVLVAELDEAALDVEVRREEPSFPHVHGSIRASAVVRIGPLRRDPAGGWSWPTEWAYGKP